MALFDLSKVENENNDDYSNIRRIKYKRSFKEDINERKIFKSAGDRDFLSWGVDDKIYRATDYGFEIVRFKNRPNKEEGEDYFTQVQSLNLQVWKGKVIDGGASYFGTIVECENALVVLLSNGQTKTIEGPITRWRIYPRSMNYQNHLHVIKDDRLEIFSFNQDYFLNQNDKLLGIEHRVPKDRFRNV